VETLGSAGNGQGFVKEGARVYFTGRRQQNSTRHRPARSACDARPGDVAKPADLDRLYDQIRSEMGRVDVVFANAGGRCWPRSAA